MNEKRILYILLSIIAALYLLEKIWGILGMFSDVFLILVLSWLLAFVLDPVVKQLTQKGLSRLAAAIATYLVLAILLVIIGIVIIPTTVYQLTTLGHALPTIIETAPPWLSQLVSNTLTNSVTFVQNVTSTIFNLVLVLIFSFYFLTDRDRIGKIIYDLLPDDWEGDFKFFENVVSVSFAGFLRVQVALGVIIGFATYLVLIILGVNYALTTSMASGVLAVVPVIGPALAVLPPLLPAFMISTNVGIITFTVLFLLQQIIYNVISPGVLGEALKLHPLLVLLSFIVGFKIGGFWGAVFAVPVASAFAIIAKEFLYHFKSDD